MNEDPKLTTAVAKALGFSPIYYPAPPDDPHQPSRINYYANKEGVRIWLSSGGYAMQGKIRISPHWPEDHNGRGFTVYENNQPVGVDSCEASVSRGVEAIAKDFSRRFLPKYIEKWPLFVARKQELLAQSNERLDALKSLSKACGIPTPMSKHRSADYEPNYQFSINVGTVEYVRFDVSSPKYIKFEFDVPLDKALRIIEVMKGA